MTQQPKQPKRPPIEWIVNLPSHDPYGKVSFRTVCRGNGDLGDMLNYFIYAASYEVKHNHADKTTGFITVERTLDDIVDYLDVSKKTATTYIRKLAEWEFLIPHGYHHCYDVNFKKVDELIASPPEADKPKPRGKYAKRKDGKFTIPTICEEDGKDSTDSRDEQIRELMEEIVNLRSQMVDLSSTIIKLLSLPSFKDTPEEDLGAILEPLKKIKNLERKERDSLGDFVVTPSPQGDNETEYQQFPIDTDATECIAEMATGNDLEDDDETLHRLPKVTLNGACHDDTPATTHPSVPVGTDRATGLPLARGSTPGMVSRQSTLQAGYVSSLQVQQGQEATQVQVIPSQQTVPVPPAAVPPPLHPSQQATNAPVASVPPGGAQRGAGETKRTRPKKPVQPTQERLPEPVFTLTEQQQHFWEMWCNIWFNQGVPLHLTKTAYGHVDTLAPIITTPEQLESLTKKARQDLEATTGIGRKTVQLGNCVYSLPGWRQDQRKEQEQQSPAIKPPPPSVVPIEAIREGRIAREVQSVAYR